MEEKLKAELEKLTAEIAIKSKEIRLAQRKRFIVDQAIELLKNGQVSERAISLTLAKYNINF